VVEVTQRVILFNGPPRSGKDTAARACLEAEDLNGHLRVFDRMSMPIKRAFAAMMGENIDRWGNVGYFEEHKEEPNELLGCSYRQWQIDFSEKFMKPLYEENIFGRLFINRAWRQSKNAVIFTPDCGFDIEYTTLANAFGQENVLVVKIYRPGTGFKGDSRTYLKVGSFGDKRDTEHVIHTNNAGTEDEFKKKIVSRVSRWLEGHV
jgi:hypothetical protein